MSEKDTPFNLFSSSGKKPADKAADSGSEAARKPAAPPPPTKPHKTPQNFDAKTQVLFDQIKEMQDAINSKLDFITHKSGMSKEEVMKMVQGPATAKSDLNKMNADLQAFAERVWGALGPDIVPKKTKSVKGTNTIKDRNAKTLGSRRNWLRMP